LGWLEGDPYVIGEVYSVGKTTEEIIKLCNAANIPKDVTAWADSAEPDRIKQFKQGGFKVYGVRKEKNSVINQITWLKARKIFIDGRCLNTAREIQGYKWVKNPTTGDYEDTPVNFNDDCMKAFAYATESMRKQTRLKTMKKGDLGIW
jgi:phage terminase large subunit